MRSGGSVSRYLELLILFFTLYMQKICQSIESMHCTYHEIFVYFDTMDEQLEFVKIITSRLDSATIPYMMTGSMAMAIYAVPRMTRDIDLVIECLPEDSTRIAGLFESDCYVDADSIRDAAERQSMFNIIHNEWVIKADFIVRKDEEYRRLEFDRRRQFDIEGTLVWVVAPEDLILSKLCWSRESGSELQLRDVKTIIESVEELDWAYLDKWASTLDLTDLMNKARSE